MSNTQTYKYEISFPPMIIYDLSSVTVGSFSDKILFLFKLINVDKMRRVMTAADVISITHFGKINNRPLD